MPHITICTDCRCLYEAGSEEQANDPEERWCPSCAEERRRFGPRPAVQPLTDAEKRRSLLDSVREDSE